MAMANIVNLTCPDCDASLDAKVGGPEAVCPTDGCDRRFKVWSKRRLEEALEFEQKTPSFKPKRLLKLADGRWIVSYVYHEVPRRTLASLTDIFRTDDDLELLTLLLEGLSAKMEIPMLLEFFGPDGQAQRIDSTSARNSILCILVHILGAKEQCLQCDRNRLEENLNRSISSFSTEPYACWAGLSELSCPVVVGGVMVCLFITGQIYRNTSSGEAELWEGLERIADILPCKLDGQTTISWEQLREKGADTNRLRLLWEELHLSPEMPLTITKESLFEIARIDARINSHISERDDLQEFKTRANKAIEAIQSYLQIAYGDIRRLSEQQFLGEVHSLLECLPREALEGSRLWQST